jgi:protein-S-isoprenylcysteine O-methyltransferase Ste14
MRVSLRSNSTRVFVAYPAVVALEQVLSRRRWHPVALPLLAAGYGTYTLAGRYRLPRAGGPPGMSQGMPERLVTDGVYAWTRNPMYLGHLVFLTGLALLTRSPVAVALLGALGPWYGTRVAADEQRLRQAFGEEYTAYAARVPRWLPHQLLGRLVRRLADRLPGRPAATLPARPDPGSIDLTV